tara:strand:- start:77 stop:508 length:432 start_codon:yes stop_codon:yes gene_type:complete
MFRENLCKFLLVFILCFSAQCYKAPFFELTIKVVDQDLDPVKNVSVQIVATDVEAGNLDIIEDADLTDLDGNDLVCETNGSGECQFSFEKKAFLTVLACFNTDNNNAMCQETYVYLKEDENVISTIMLVEYDQNDYNCSYCTE